MDEVDQCQHLGGGLVRASLLIRGAACLDAALPPP